MRDIGGGGGGGGLGPIGGTPDYLDHLRGKDVDIGFVGQPWIFFSLALSHWVSDYLSECSSIFFWCKSLRTAWEGLLRPYQHYLMCR